MKKKSLISLLFLPLLITSCGGNAGNETKLPNNGTAIDRTVGKEKLKAAVKSEVDSKDESDAFGFSVKDAHFSETLDGSLAVANQSIATISSKVEAKNGTFNFGIKGLTGTKANDLTATLSASINVTGNYNTTYNNQITMPTAVADASIAPSTNMEFKGDYAVSANLLENNLYLDLSNKQVYSLVSTLLGTNSALLPASGKAKFALNLKDESFPIVDSTDAEKFDENYEEFYESLPDDGEFKDHGKAGYSYSGKISATELNKKKDDDSDTSKSIIPTSSYNYNYSADSAFNYALIFNESGFVSFGIDASLGLSMTIETGTTDVYGYGYKMTYNGTVSFGLKFEFLKGSDVKFPTVDTSAYTAATIKTAE